MQNKAETSEESINGSVGLDGNEECVCLRRGWEGLGRSKVKDETEKISRDKDQHLCFTAEEAQAQGGKTGRLWHLLDSFLPLEPAAHPTAHSLQMRQAACSCC